MTTSSGVKAVAYEYLKLTLATVLLVIGVYMFKFPNNFTFGGVTGMSVVLTAVLSVSASTLTSILNISLLIVGFLFIGRSFGIKTVYVTILMSILLELCERYLPMTQPLTSQPMLELVFAVIFPAISSAILFNMDASSGGTDIVAMILKKYTSMDIGKSLLLVDMLVTASSFFFFGVETGLFSVCGLVAKTFVIDGAIEDFNLCKYFTIISDNPDPIVDFIHDELHRSATLEKAEGSYLHQSKTVIMTVTRRRQAVQLRNFIRRVEPTAFMMITNSSEIIGKGFRGFN
ncbi:MAG: YitT family protein [Oscillospiraceae bacterium]|nr:YitT family protein [Oscillospiraceae bacterium]